MANYFCKLNLLSNFASEVDHDLKELEDIVLQSDYETNFAFQSKTESGRFCLIRTACKAYHHRGCEKSGLADQFKTYLQTKNKNNLLERFVGNRFSIAFYNAGALFFHKEDMKMFFNQVVDPNRPIKAVQEGISNKFISVNCKP